MKSLYESIIGSNSAGIESKIREWCDAHNIYNGDYVIGKDKKIYKGPSNLVARAIARLSLDYSDYDELPDYINFGHCDSATLVVGQKVSKHGSFEPLPTIKSFRGLPDEAFAVIIRPMKNAFVPSWHIKTSKFTMLCSHLTKGTDKIIIDVPSTEISRIDLRPDVYSTAFKYNITVNGQVDTFYWRDDHGEPEFAKLIRNKAPMNKKTVRSDDQPLTPEAQNIVNAYFKGIGIDMDMKGLGVIDYVQASRLVKGKDHLWYRRPGD